MALCSLWEWKVVGSNPTTPIIFWKFIYIAICIYMSKFLIILIDYIVFFSLIVISISWLLESNFSILLNFILIYLLTSIIFIVIGFEFLGILLLLLYSTGIAVVFIIISMAVGTQHIYLSNNDYNKKERSLDAGEYDDVYIVQRNNIVYGLMSYFFIISIFFILDFFIDSGYNMLVILSFQSISGVLSAQFLTTLNDIYLIGILIFQEYYIYTTLIGLLLLVSLISSIYISE